MKKKVYVALSADVLHGGHINILKIASKFGNVIVGLLTDKAITTYKDPPLITYKHREVILKNIRLVKKVIAQKTLDYTENLEKIRPHFVVHGDDWKKGIQKETREKVLIIIKKWNGKLIEPKYTKGISSTKLKKKLKLLILDKY
jgi:phosphoenolpyruvate phosphomutase